MFVHIDPTNGFEIMDRPVTRESVREVTGPRYATNLVRLQDIDMYGMCNDAAHPLGLARNVVGSLTLVYLGAMAIVYAGPIVIVGWGHDGMCALGSRQVEHVRACYSKAVHVMAGCPSDDPEDDAKALAYADYVTTAERPGIRVESRTFL